MITMKGAEQLSYDVAEVFEDGGTVAWKVGNGGVIERVDVRISTSDGERSDAVRVVGAGTDVQVKPPRLRHAEHGEGQGERRGACHACRCSCAGDTVDMFDVRRKHAKTCESRIHAKSSKR